jgi:hypothetical protein
LYPSRFSSKMLAVFSRNGQNESAHRERIDSFAMWNGLFYRVRWCGHVETVTVKNTLVKLTWFFVRRFVLQGRSGCAERRLFADRRRLLRGRRRVHGRRSGRISVRADRTWKSLCVAAHARVLRRSGGQVCEKTDGIYHYDLNTWRDHDISQRVVALFYGRDG